MRARFLTVAAIALALSAPAMAQTRLQPEDLRYLGAFRLPDHGERPLTFAWGGNAMAFRPAEARAPGAGELPGSLFLMGHDRMAYGALPDGNQVAELSIPVPALAAAPGALPTARFLQPFSDVAAGQFAGLDELPRTGLAWLETEATGPRLHLAWGQHFQLDPPVPTHGSVSPDLSQPDFSGPWNLGEGLDYATNGYLFPVAPRFAQEVLGGPALAAGRFRDGGWSGMGPALFAYAPPGASGALPPEGSALAAQPLLHYRSSRETDGYDGAMAGYQHPDEWEGGAWIETQSGASAVIFSGTKSTGAKHWYGFVNPAGPERPCVAGEFVGNFPVCRLADGQPCPPEDLQECTGHNGFRGWWSSGFEAWLVFYDPDDLARVARGEWESWQPQPYAHLALDAHLFLNPDGIEPETLGTGVQRRYRIGPASYDPQGQRLFVVEMFAEGDKPVVHVWQID